MPHVSLTSPGMAGLLAALAGPALAQAPTLTATNPTRQATNAPRNASPQFSFSQAVTGAGGIRVQGNRWRGYHGGTGSGNNTNTLVLQPRVAFAPGEEVSVSVPGSINTGGQGLAGGGQVVQFRAAAGPATGSFTSGPALSRLGNYLYTILLADVNNDGRLDLLQQDGLYNQALLRLGDGQGSFGAVAAVGNDVAPNSLVVADFNNDGNLDVASFGAGAFQPYRNPQVQLGNGAGGFGPTTILGTQALQIPRYLQAADFNADGNQDLVFAHYSGTGGELRVLLGNGQGGFASQPVLALPANSSSYGGLLVTDVNNDGRLDCLLLAASTGQLGFYQGNGQGGFTLAATPALALTPSSTTVATSFLDGAADFTGDGKVDVLLRDPATNALRLYPGDGLGSFGTPTALATTNIQRVAVGDLEGDGDLDAVVVTLNRSSSTDFYVTAWLNNGSGTFTPSAGFNQYAQSVGLGDLNNDGTTDLLIYNDGLGGPVPGDLLLPRLGQPLATAPTISQVTVNASSTAVTLTGTNLGSATAVLVGGQPVTFAVVGGTLVLDLPAGYGGYITVITPTGTATSQQRVSGTLAVRPAAAGRLAVELYPVPAHDAVQLTLPTAAAVQASLYDPLGRLTRTTTLTAPAGRPASLPLTGLAPGLYTLRLVAGPDVAMRQLLVE